MTDAHALLVVDVQESFRAPGARPGWGTASRPGVASSVAALVDAARRRGHLVVWILHQRAGSGGPFDPALGHVRLQPPLDPAPGEPVVRKSAHNAFTGTELGPVLEKHGVTGVAVCGIRTEQCCETTARVAADLGYRVDFIADATATHPIAAPGADPDRSDDELIADPATLQAADVEERTVRVLSGRFAAIRTAEDYCAGS